MKKLTTAAPMLRPRPRRARGITFSPLMVLALSQGRKTQTRRLVQPQPIFDPDSGYVFDGKHREMYKHDLLHKPWKEQFLADWFPFGEVGDFLYVREAWRTSAVYDHLSPKELPDDAPIQYEADGALVRTSTPMHGRYRHGRFMPRKFARIWVEIEGRGLQALEAITEEDAVAEGADQGIYGPYGIGDCQLIRVQWGSSCGNYRDGFRYIWHQLHGEKSWDENPWVWKTTFARTTKEIAYAQCQL